MFDINNIINAAINAAVNARLTEVLQQHANTIAPLMDRIHNLDAICQAQAERIAALEQNEEFLTNRIARLEAAAPQPAITIDEARMVEALNSQEWFWEKLHNTINDNVVSRVEEAIDEHCSGYDHDNYDEMASKLDDLPDFDDFVKDGDLRDSVREYVEDALNNATFSVSI